MPAMHAIFTTDPSKWTAHQVADRMHLAFVVSTIGVLVGGFRGVGISETTHWISNGLSVGLLITGALLLRSLARGVSTRRLFAITVGLLMVLTITAALPYRSDVGSLALLLAVPIAFSAGTSGLCLERGLDRSAESWRTLTTLFAWISAGTMLVALEDAGSWSIAQSPFLLSDVIIPLFFTVFVIGAMLAPFLVPWAAYRMVQAQREQHIGDLEASIVSSTRA
ncbi:MAG: hypothetical protein AAGE94_22240 [Acidobacteriota bacterium]